VHYSPAAGHRARLDRERLFHKPERICEQAAKESRAAAGTMVQQLAQPAFEAFLSGIEAAPLFVGFVMFVAESALRERLERLFFLTREGEFLYRVYQRIHLTNSCSGIALPPASLLHVSRTSTQPAALTRPTEDILTRRRWPYRNHTVQTLLSAMGLHFSSVSDPLARAGLAVDTLVSHPSLDPRIQKLCRDKDFVTVAETSVEQIRRTLQLYLRGEGLGSTGRYGVVDIGWRGTIQENLAAVVPSAEIHGMYLALREQLTAQPPNTRKSAYLFVEGQHPHAGRLLETYGLMELLTTSATGSTTGYAMRHGKLQPLYEAVNDECPCFEAVVRPFQEGVLFASDIWRKHLLRNGCSSRDLTKTALATWRRLERTPHGSIVHAFLHTRMHDPYAAEPELIPEDAPDLRTIARSPYDRAAWARVKNYVTRVQWRTAIRASGSRGVVSSTLLGSLCTVRALYRQSKQWRSRISRFR
jgi:hypothetical protein